MFNEIFGSMIKDLEFIYFSGAFQSILKLSPYILAAILLKLFLDLRIQYLRAKFTFSQKYTLIEIKIPKEQVKSPLAMELFLNSFHNTADGTWYDQYFLGKSRPVFSLEIVSIEGQVKFFIWLPQGSKQFIETSLYAQFPGIEVTERQDYARSITYDPEIMNVWATEFQFTKEDAYPIKTYVDYGLDRDPKEEYKVDPLVPFLEYLGAVGPNQQVWLQIIIRAHKKDQPKAGHLFKKTDKWKDQAQAEINKILIRDQKSKLSGEPDEEHGFIKSPTITKGEQEVVAALERSISKPAFDAGIRAVYIAKKDFFNPVNIGGMIGSFKNFSSEHLNGFKPGGPWMGRIEYPWQDFRDIRRKALSRKVIMAYKRRAFFLPPFNKGKRMVLNTEELATIFHFPGTVSATPTLDRVVSKKSEAPANLPI